MNNVSKEKYASRAECIFSLSGGFLKWSSYNFTRIRSVNITDLNSVRVITAHSYVAEVNPQLVLLKLMQHSLGLQLQRAI